MLCFYLFLGRLASKRKHAKEISKQKITMYKKREDTRIRKKKEFKKKLLE